MMNKVGFQTRCVHSGERLDPMGAIHTPLYNHSTFGFPNTESLLDVVEGRKPGSLYTRYGFNPTIVAVEEKLAALEDGETALVFGSGMAAEAALFLSLCKTGDHVICLGDLYGGTFELLSTNLPELGISTTFLDGNEAENLSEAIRGNTRVVFFETPSNPNLEVFDIRKISQICAKRRVLSVVDSTFASPVNQNPLALGADLVVHSATKYLGGHSDITGGAVVGKGDLLRKIALWRKNLGQVMAPDVAFLLARSLRTLGVRVRAQNESAMLIAEFLAKNPKVKTVNYPGLPAFSGHAIAKTQMRGFGGMISFLFAGDAHQTAALVDRLKIFSIAPSLGGVESLVTQPVTTTHHGLSETERVRRGILPGTVRLSIGLEDTGDLIADLEQAIG